VVALAWIYSTLYGWASLPVYLYQISANLSPTHKKTEGRALVWGSELTSKDATIQGGLAEIAPTLNAKF